MDRRILFLTLAAVLLTAATSVIVFIVLPQQAQQSPAPGGVGQTAISAEACGEPAVILVYERGQEPGLLLDLVRQSLERNGVKADYCSVEADRIGFRLRAYPAFLVKGDIEALENITVPLRDGYRLVDYGLIIFLYNQLAMRGIQLPPLKYTYEARALVVEGETPWGKAAEDRLGEALRRLQQFALANITGYEVVNRSSYPDLGFYPAVVLVSDQNLSLGLSNIRPLGSGEYVFAEYALPHIAALLSSKPGFEAHAEPPGLSEAAGWGSSEAPLVLVIYEDYACPYCEKFYREVYPALEKLVENGSLRLATVDFIVHQEVVDTHVAARCVYEALGPEAYHDTVLYVYEVLGEKGEPATPDDVLGMVRERWGEDAARKVGKCIDTRASGIRELFAGFSREAPRYGITGTPGVVVWAPRLGYGVVFLGYHPANQILEAITWLLNQ